MERASRLLGNLRIPSETLSLEQLARAVWPTAVGAKIASHARVARMVRSTLIVEVEDEIWKKQLTALRPQIMKNFLAKTGRPVVQEIEFRVAPVRLGPQRALASTAEHSRDEAERIEDPGLRRIYKASRKKALG
jgi:predicted nucleic acid-binding Zn ribbon protein